MLHTRILRGAICAMGLIASLPVICAAEAYSVSEIPLITHAVGVNRDGVVVGETGSPAISFVYVHSSGAVDELPTGFSASDVNDQGQIVGDHSMSTSPANVQPPVAAILYLSGGEKILTVEFFFFSLGHAISNSGVFAAGQGFVIGQKGQVFFVPFLWQVPDDSVTQLPLLAGNSISLPEIDGDARGVNDDGTVVGNSGIRILDAAGNPIGIAIHAVRWRDGAVDLGTLPGGENSDANAINDRGEIVGNSDTASGASHAFLLRHDKMSDLGTLGRDRTLNSDANRINRRGEIVGWSQIRLPDQSVIRHAFVSHGGALRDLNGLIDKKSPLYGSVTLTSANAISSNGWIAADGFDDTTMQPHAYLLIPHGH